MRSVTLLGKMSDPMFSWNMIYAKNCIISHLIPSFQGKGTKCVDFKIEAVLLRKYNILGAWLHYSWTLGKADTRIAGSDLALGHGTMLAVLTI